MDMGTLLEDFPTKSGTSVTKEYQVHVEWELSDRDPTERWDQICVYAIEEFGLPGDRFRCEATQEYMNFWFQDPYDAAIFRLRWGIV